MNSSRFFKKTRNIFGTPLLQMKPNTIRSLCVSNKFHFSIKIQNNKLTLLDSMSINISNPSSSLLKQLESSDELQDMDELVVKSELMSLLSSINETVVLRRGVLPSLLAGGNLLGISTSRINMKCGLGI